MSNDDDIEFVEHIQPNGDIISTASKKYYSSIVIRKEDIDKYTDEFREFVKKRLQHVIEHEIKKDGLGYMEILPLYYMGNQIIVDPVLNETQTFILMHPKLEAEILQDKYAHVRFKEPKAILKDERDR
jgi:hypothetical protein